MCETADIFRHEGSWQRGLVNTLSGIKVLVNLVDTGETQVRRSTLVITRVFAPRVTVTCRKKGGW